MRLMVQAGEGCAALLDVEMRNLPCKRIRVGEIWAYVGKKQCHTVPSDNRARVGDQWTFVALDPDTKLIPTFRVGKRDLRSATAFLSDLSERLTNRLQLSSDALKAYVEATEQVFGADVDYGRAVKFCDVEPSGAGRDSPPKVVRSKLDHAHEHPAMHTPDRWFFQEVGKPQGRCCPAHCTLQLCAASQDDPLHPRYGGRGEQSAMVT